MLEEMYAAVHVMSLLYSHHDTGPDKPEQKGMYDMDPLFVSQARLSTGGRTNRHHNGCGGLVEHKARSFPQLRCLAPNIQTTRTSRHGLGVSDAEIPKISSKWSNLGKTRSREARHT